MRKRAKCWSTNVVFGSAAEKAGIDFDWEILGIEVETDRMPKQLLFLPALVLLALVWVIQRGRRGKSRPPAEA